MIALKASLGRVKQANRRLGVRVAYAWDVDVEAYYSTRRPSRTSPCDLPYTRLDIHTDGHMALCVSGKRSGHIARQSIAEVWSSGVSKDFRALYERIGPMPMCFRCCGLSQTIRFDGNESSRPGEERLRRLTGF